VHLLGKRKPREGIVVRGTKKRFKDTGRFDHIAFAASDIGGVRKKLKSKKVKFREQTIPRTGGQQIFLRFHPNQTRDHLDLVFGEDVQPRVVINRRIRSDSERLARVNLKGMIHLDGSLGRKNEVAVTRTIFPSTTQPIVFDRTVLTNRTDKDMLVELDDIDHTVRTKSERGVFGSYLATATIVGAQSAR